MSENTYNLDEQLDAVLYASVEGEQPEQHWKVGLIETIDTHAQKQQRNWWFTISTAITIPVMAVFGFMFVDSMLMSATGSVGIVETTERNADSAFTGFGGGDSKRILSQWTKEHVSYQASEGLELPYPLQEINRKKMALSKKKIDTIVAQINPDFSEDENEKSNYFEYSTGAERFTVEFQRNGISTFEWLPQEWPQDINGGVKYPLDAMTCAENEDTIRHMLESTLSSLVVDAYELRIDSSEETANTCKLFYRINDHIEFQAFRFVFDGTDLVTVRGKIMTNIALSKTKKYGALDEILADLNAMPTFPFSAHEPEVNVVYEVSDYRITPQGLQLYMGVENLDAVYEALDAVGISEFPQSIINDYEGMWVTMETSRERKKKIKEIHSQNE